ncbi:unnamed protein product [Tenebrio molitor]|nr:unnamed protein product [Tenebrio molitor]
MQIELYKKCKRFPVTLFCLKTLHHPAARQFYRSIYVTDYG